MARRGSEVALFGTESALRGLDVVEACLGFDDRLEVSGWCCVASCGPDRHDAVGAAQVAWERDRDLGLPRDVRPEPGREPLEQGDVGLVANGWPDRMNTDAQFGTQRRCHTREEIEVDVRSDPSFDAPDLRV